MHGDTHVAHLRSRAADRSRPTEDWLQGSEGGRRPGQPDVRRREAARVNSSARGAASSPSASILLRLCRCAMYWSRPVPVR